MTTTTTTTITKKERKAYILIDEIADKSNPGFGFANTKRVLACHSLADARQIYQDRCGWDLSCQIITRKRALPYRETGYTGLRGFWMANSPTRYGFYIKNFVEIKK